MALAVNELFEFTLFKENLGINKICITCNQFDASTSPLWGSPLVFDFCVCWRLGNLNLAWVG